jgi:hypothetical protein
MGFFLLPGLVLAWLGAAALAAQTTSSPVERPRVLVPDIEGITGSGRLFAQDLTAALRERLSTSDRYRLVTAEDLAPHLVRFGLQGEDVTCATGRQLAFLADIPVVICAVVGPEASNRQRSLTWLILGAWPDRDENLPVSTVEEAVELILQGLDDTVDLVRRHLL